MLHSLILSKHVIVHNKETGLSQPSKRNRGVLVLHIGPAKTGTSSLQCIMQTTPFLRNNSYFYLGKFQNGCTKGKYFSNSISQIWYFQIWPRMIVFKKSYESGKFLKTQIAQLNDASNSKHTNNIIVSAEEFDQMYLKDEETWNLVKDTFSPYQGRTHVIATYRHLHEIIVSYYYEKVVGRNIRKLWTRSDIASFPTYWSQSDKKEFMLTDLIASFEQHSFNVSVFNYHEDSKSSDDLVTRFLCNLPHADATCEAV